jgi:hypothetical protein
MKQKMWDLYGRLSYEDAELFQKLWFELMNYVNSEKKIDPKTPKIDTIDDHTVEMLLPIRDYTFDHPEVIDEFIASPIASSFTEEEKAIVLDWKRGFCELFFLLKIQRDCAFLLLMKDDNDILAVFAVMGVDHSWCDIYRDEQLPMMVICTLLPFKGKIVHDGIVLEVITEPPIDRDLKLQLSTMYHDVMMEYGIIDTFDYADIDKILERESVFKEVFFDTVSVKRQFFK